MKLEDLVKPIREQTDDELQERLRLIRHNRFVVRPAAAARAEKEEAKGEKKAARSAGSKMDRMLAALSPEAREMLIKQLTEGTGTNGGEAEGNQT